MDAPSPESPSVPALPRLSRRLRMQFEPVQDAHVLLYPEGMVRLNASAAAILELCDGHRSPASIVAALHERFDAPDLTGEVEAWLILAARQGWIEDAGEGATVGADVRPAQP